jgi:ligand-binding sensor domain-containing protein
MTNEERDTSEGRGRIGRIVPKKLRTVLKTDVEAFTPAPKHPGWLNLASQRYAQAIAVAPRSGLLWLATWGGVLAWDRDRQDVYRRYSSEHGLAGNAVACLCVDRSDRPWAGHLEGGLSYFDGEHWQIYEGSDSETPGPTLRTQPVRAVCRGTRTGDIWAATADTVYYIVGPDEDPEPVIQDQNAAVEALALLADGDERVLLGNAWGLFRLERGHAPQPVAAEEIGACTALARDTAGQVWIGTPWGVHRLAEEGNTATDRIAPDAGAWVVDLAAGKQRVWVLTTTGLARIDGDCWQPVQWKVRRRDNDAVKQGRSGRDSRPVLRAIAPSTVDDFMWTGTDERLGAVWLIEDQEIVLALDYLPEHIEDGLNNLGRCITGAGDSSLWVGTAAGLLALESNGTWIEHPVGGDVRALCLAGPPASQKLWILSWPHGVGWLDESGVYARRRLKKGLPVALATGQDRYPYVLTSQGLWKLVLTGPKGNLLSLERVARGPEYSVRCLAQTPDSTWWLGTTEGVYRRVYGREDWVWQHEGGAGEPRRVGVNAMGVVDDGLWVATDSGLWAWKQGRWQQHPIDPQNSNMSVRALAPAGVPGALWLAREDGVVRYQPQSGPTLPFTLAESGLASLRVAGLLERAGVLWIVTQAGISRVDLAQVGEPW